MRLLILCRKYFHQYRRKSHLNRHCQTIVMRDFGYLKIHLTLTILAFRNQCRFLDVGVFASFAVQTATADLWDCKIWNLKRRLFCLLQTESSMNNKQKFDLF